MVSDDVTEEVEREELYMVKCDDCKRIVRYTPDLRESYAGTICKTCKRES